MFLNPFLNGFAKCYLWFTNFFSNFQSIFIFVLRIIWGHQFFLAGLEKFHNMPETVSFFFTIGIPFPEFSAHFIALLEVIGGILLIIGFASRFVGFLFCVSMTVAYSTAHVHVFNLKLIQNTSTFVKEEPFAFLVTSLIVLLFGPGKIALDGWLKRWVKNREHFYS